MLAQVRDALSGDGPAIMPHERPSSVAGSLPAEVEQKVALVVETSGSTARPKRVLLSSDAHLRGVDFKRLTLLLQGFDVAAPVIATPREIVRKFCR